MASIFSVAGLLFALSAGAQSLLGERVEFPVRNGNSLTVCPKGDHLAVVSAFSCLLFVADEGSGRWLGPFSAPNGGFSGTRANPDFDLAARRKLPLYSWTLLPNGEAALVLNPVTNRAVTLSGNSVLEITTSSEIEWQLLDAQSGRIRKYGADAPRDIAKRIQSAYLEFKGPARATEGC